MLDTHKPQQQATLTKQNKIPEIFFRFRFCNSTERKSQILGFLFIIACNYFCEDGTKDTVFATPSLGVPNPGLVFSNLVISNFYATMLFRVLCTLALALFGAHLRSLVSAGVSEALFGNAQMSTKSFYT